MGQRVPTRRVERADGILVAMEPNVANVGQRVRWLANGANGGHRR